MFWGQSQLIVCLQIVTHLVVWFVKLSLTDKGLRNVLCHEMLRKFVRLWESLNTKYILNHFKETQKGIKTLRAVTPSFTDFVTFSLH